MYGAAYVGSGTRESGHVIIPLHLNILKKTRQLQYNTSVLSKDRRSTNTLPMK